MTFETSTLMCAPDFFDVEYSINPWMSERNPRVDADLAMSQWTDLAAALSRQTEVRLLPPKAGLPDLCFTANAGLIKGNIFVASTFRFPQRAGEQREFCRWFDANGYRCVVLDDDTVFEGAGDALFDDSGRLFMGYGQRSERKAADQLSDLLDVEVIELELADPRFYHLDTCLAFVGARHVVYFPDAFTPASNRIIERLVPAQHRIVASADDANRLACNLVTINDEVFMNSGATHVSERLRALGFRVTELALSEFLKSGGSAKCLTFSFGNMLSDTSRCAESAADVRSSLAVVGSS